MEFKAGHILKSLVLLLLCCAFFAGKGRASEPAVTITHKTVLLKVASCSDATTAPLIKFNFLDGPQKAIRLAHKTNNPGFTAYLLAQNTGTCIKCFNYFSGYNDHRYTLTNADFLYPFHAFW